MELRVIRVMCIKLRKPGWYLKARIDAIRGFGGYRLQRKENLQLLRNRWREFMELKKKRISPLGDT